MAHVGARLRQGGRRESGPSGQGSVMSAGSPTSADRRSARADLEKAIAWAEERRATYLGILERWALGRREVCRVRGMLHLADEDLARLRRRLERSLGSVQAGRPEPLPHRNGPA